MKEQDNYLKSVIEKHSPDIYFIVEHKIKELIPHIHSWANGYRYEIKLSGSLAKGTGISGTTDIDIFISLHHSVKEYNTLNDVYFTLRNKMKKLGYSVREQNVSLGLDHTGLKIDIVPGVKHGIFGLDHSIWKRKKQTWTKTNIDSHINLVKNSGRVNEIKLIKIWRKNKGLDFPSFYLELSVIEALKGTSLIGSSLSNNFIKIMNYFVSEFETKTIKDPANENNEVSEELTNEEKKKIKQFAISTLEGSWEEAVS